MPEDPLRSFYYAKIRAFSSDPIELAVKLSPDLSPPVISFGPLLNLAARREYFLWYPP